MTILDLDRAPHGGRVRLLPDNAAAPRISPRLLILHSAVSPSLDATWRYFATGTNLESTFGVGNDGYLEQWMDTERKADANYRANPFAISVETMDRGDPDTQPWTPEQLDALVWLARECHRVHPAIPLRRADAWDGSGIGYHTMWGAPGPWTPVSKTCPGRVRIRQFNEVLLPRIVRGGGEEGLLATEAQQILDAIAALRRDLTVYGTTGLEATAEDFATRQRQTLAKLDELLARPPVDSGGDDGGPTPVVVRLADDQLATLKAEVLAELRGAVVELALPQTTAQAVGDLLAGRLQS